MIFKIHNRFKNIFLIRCCAWFLKQGSSLLPSLSLPSPCQFSIKDSCIFEDQCTTKTSTQILSKTQRSEIDALQMVFFLYGFYDDLCYRTVPAAQKEVLPNGSPGISKGHCRHSEFSQWQFCEVSESFPSSQFMGKGLDAGSMPQFTGYVDG